MLEYRFSMEDDDDDLDQESPINMDDDIGDYDEMNLVWREFFPVDPPARTTCALQLSNGNGVEIECIALAATKVAESC